MGSRGSWEVREFRVAAQGLKKKGRRGRRERRRRRRRRRKKKRKKKRKRKKKEKKKKKQGEKEVSNSIYTNSRSSAPAAVMLH